MTIGTAKPSPEMLETVRHHFINEKEIGEPFSAGDFVEEAGNRIRQIHECGRLAIVAGGSTLYIEGLLQGFSPLPPSDPGIRDVLRQELLHNGAEALYRRLKALDPEQAQTLDPTKTQRLIRSLEIIEITGRTVTELLKTPKQEQKQGKMLIIGLHLPRALLYERINTRTDDMMQAGLLEEARELHGQYGNHLRGRRVNALETVGYRELFHYFDGIISLESAVDLIRQQTRNYAKRQLTFFKNRLNVEWIDSPLNQNSLNALTGRICRILSSEQ
jgi:tRNA dimethylallyltransferase